ncbi:MAG: hypothetical protein M5R40_29075 [Anaerolineae bacterium]|nr:hypothetical protein [Anaerolineae bacterium]
MLIYEEGFNQNRAGYAAAMALVLSVIIIGVSAAIFTLQSRHDDEA